MNELRLTVGDRCVVFDSDTWRKTGDIGDNSQFYLQATIVAERTTVELNPRQIVDVKFDDGRISNGHFKTSIRSI